MIQSWLENAYQGRLSRLDGWFHSVPSKTVQQSQDQCVMYRRTNGNTILSHPPTSTYISGFIYRDFAKIRNMKKFDQIL